MSHHFLSFQPSKVKIVLAKSALLPISWLFLNAQLYKIFLRFGTTLMAMCFYRIGYNSQKFENAEPYFRDLCLKEFEYSCKEENLEKHPINLYFCDKVSDERLKQFLKKVSGETFRRNMF